MYKIVFIKLIVVALKAKRTHHSYPFTLQISPRTQKGVGYRPIHSYTWALFIHSYSFIHTFGRRLIHSYQMARQIIL